MILLTILIKMLYEEKQAKGRMDIVNIFGAKPESHLVKFSLLTSAFH